MKILQTVQVKSLCSIFEDLLTYEICFSLIFLFSSPKLTIDKCGGAFCSWIYIFILRL